MAKAACSSGCAISRGWRSDCAVARGVISGCPEAALRKSSEVAFSRAAAAAEAVSSGGRVRAVSRRARRSRRRGWRRLGPSSRACRVCRTCRTCRACWTCPRTRRAVGADLSAWRRLELGTLFTGSTTALRREERFAGAVWRGAATDALWAWRCAGLARPKADDTDRTASAAMAARAGMEAFKRISISEARNARAPPTLETGERWCK